MDVSDTYPIKEDYRIWLNRHDVMSYIKTEGKSFSVHLGKDSN